MVFFSLSLHSVCYFVWVCLDRTHNEYEMCLKLNKKKFVKNDVKKKKARNSFICKLEHWLKNTRKLKKKKQKPNHRRPEVNLHTCNPFPFNGSAQAIFFFFTFWWVFSWVVVRVLCRYYAALVCVYVTIFPFILLDHTAVDFFYFLVFFEYNFFFHSSSLSRNFTCR